MRPTATLLLLLAPAALWAQFGAVPVSATTAPAAKVKTSAIAGPPRQEILQLEKLLDTRLYAIGTVNDPVDMLGLTRGIYLSNYGAVFSSEISLIITPRLNPFRPTITKELHDQVHNSKLDRLPALRTTLLRHDKQAAARPCPGSRQQQIRGRRASGISGLGGSHRPARPDRHGRRRPQETPWPATSRYTEEQ